MMNKKEIAEYRAVERELRLERALRSYPFISPDVKPEDAKTKYGYSLSVWGDVSHRVEQSWTQSYRHGTGDPNGMGSQGGVSLYSKRSLALRAAQARVARHAAENLAQLQSEIDSAEAFEGKEAKKVETATAPEASKLV